MASAQRLFGSPSPGLRNFGHVFEPVANRPELPRIRRLDSSRPLKFRNQIFEAVVTDARTLRHSRCHDHVPHFQRRIAHRRRKSRLAGLFGELGSNH